MERIDKDTWRTDNGDEVRARGLSLTVEFGEKTKAEVLCAVKAVREENDRLREFVMDLADAIRHDDGFGIDRGWVIERMRDLGIEVTP